MFRELPRTIEWCKANCLFFTSFNEYIHFTVKLGTVPSNFVQSMKLTIDIVRRKRKVEQRWWKMKLGRKREGEKEREE